LVWLLFGLWAAWPGMQSGAYGLFGGNLLLFLLIGLLGWKVFGAPLQS
jgi:hypothetical protein